MDALKTALQNGSSTIASSLLLTAIAERDAARDAAAAASSAASPCRQEGPQMHLDNAGLWRQFCNMTNEMIVTKAGRRMFPVLKLHISNLDPTASYSVVLEFRCTHAHRWRFLNGTWQKGSSSEDNAEQRHMFVHFSSIALGSHWTQEPVSFAKLKLSNRENGLQKIKLNSLHKYQPHIHLVRLTSDPSEPPTITSVTFKDTQFIAVTAYQNDKVTQMKIKNNPFAKAFLGGNNSERMSSALTLSMDTIPLEFLRTNLPLSPPPPLPLSLLHPPIGVSPPPYPGCSSPQTPGYHGASFVPQCTEYTHLLHPHFDYTVTDYQAPAVGYSPINELATSLPYHYQYAGQSSSSVAYEPDFTDFYIHEGHPSPSYPCDTAGVTSVPTTASPETDFLPYHYQ